MSLQLPPLVLSVRDLENLIHMCEASIKAAEFADQLFGLEEVVQMRAIASNLQAKFQVEIQRQATLQEQRRQAEIKKKEEEAKAKAEESPKPEPELAKA